jgi:hypothetical protein
VEEMMQKPDSNEDQLGLDSSAIIDEVNILLN